MTQEPRVVEGLPRVVAKTPQGTVNFLIGVTLYLAGALFIFAPPAKSRNLASFYLAGAPLILAEPRLPSEYHPNPRMTGLEVSIRAKAYRKSTEKKTGPESA